MRRLIHIAIVTTLVAAACSTSNTTDIAASATPTAAPDTSAEQSNDWPYQFAATTVDGASLNIGDYAGQDIVLWFWAPW